MSERMSSCVLCRFTYDGHGEGHHAADCPTRAPAAPQSDQPEQGDRIDDITRLRKLVDDMREDVRKAIYPQGWGYGKSWGEMVARMKQQAAPAVQPAQGEPWPGYARILKAVRELGEHSSWDGPGWTLHVKKEYADELFNAVYALDVAAPASQSVALGQTSENTEESCGTAEIADTSTNEAIHRTAISALDTAGLLSEWPSLSKESREKVTKWFDLSCEHLQKILDQPVAPSPGADAEEVARSIEDFISFGDSGHIEIDYKGYAALLESFRAETLEQAARECEAISRVNYTGGVDTHDDYGRRCLEVAAKTIRALAATKSALAPKEGK